MNLVAYLNLHGVRHALIYLSIVIIGDIVALFIVVLPSYYGLIAYFHLSIKSRGGLVLKVCPCFLTASTCWGTHSGGVPSRFH